MPYFATADHCKLYYESKGSGNPIVFVHGWTASRLAFLFQVAELSKNYRVITYDLRGHGASDTSAITENNMTVDRLAADLHEMIFGLELDEVNVCGWSMGAAVIFNYIRLFGTDRLKSIAIVDMSPKMINDGKWNLGQRNSWTAEANMDFIVALASNFQEGIAQFLPLTFAGWKKKDAGLYPKILAEKTSFVLRNTPHCMLSLWISLCVKDYREDIKKIDVPTFLAYSGDGFLYGPEHGEYMKAHIKNSVLDIFTKSGHDLIRDEPDKFNRDYSNFLAHF